MISKICLALYTILIGYLSLIPADEISVSFWDKGLHIGAYGIFSLLAWWGFQENKKFYFAVVLIIVYGIGLEVAQLLSPGRQMSILDVLANLFGVMIIVGIRYSWASRGYSDGLGQHRQGPSDK
ncbi:MAG: VanZ family protein [Proteobacteria bacterium]|nr:VanZ family protein [Pseudomonadota bacterium]